MTRPYFVTVDGVDLKTLSFEVKSATGLWDDPLATLPEQAVYQVEGAVITDDEPVVPARDVVVSGTILGSDADDFETKRIALKRALGPKGVKDRTLVFGNQTAQQITARYMGMTGGPTDPQMLQQRVPVDLHFRCVDPALEDTTDTTLASAAAGVARAIPMGTERCYGVTTITFGGSAASATLTYKNHSGSTIATMTMTHAFVNTDVLVIDHKARSVTLNGTRNDGLLSAGFFIRFDPADAGDASLAQWPTFETDQGTLSITYRRRW